LKPVAKREISLEVNGTGFVRTVDVRKTLGDFLRDDLGFTGVHLGCEHGVCGACSVLLDGAVVRSCIMFAVQADGARITTVEGLSEDDRLSPLQEAFVEYHALQCGFCTPGMLLTAIDLLKRYPNPSELQIREALSGNLCMCTGYANIVKAVAAVSVASRGKS
jgi:carbon-monoxide dehydrogenase small subunit